MNADKADVDAAKKVLGTLAEINRLLRDHSVELRRMARVTKAQTAPMEAVLLADGPRLEGYVEATLTDGKVVCWSLDVRWDRDSWTIEATLDMKSGDRQETVKKLPTETAQDLEGFLSTLKRIVQKLLALTIADAEAAS